MEITVIARALIVAAVGVTACGKDSPSPGRRQLEELRARLDPSNTSTKLDHDRAGAALRLALMCCPDHLTAYRSLSHPTWQTPESADACKDMRSLLASERDAKVLLGALNSWGPACYESEIPPDLLAKVLDRPGLELELRVRVAEHLQLMTPTATTVQALLAQVGTRDNAVRSAITSTLGSYGELELVAVIAALDDKDSRVAAGAAMALGHAASDPLDLPELLGALERKTTSPDAMLGSQARLAADSYRRHSSVTPDAAARRLLNFDESVALRYFGRRRAFCTSKIAAETIERLRGSEDKEVASVARLASAQRAARCH